MQVLVVRGLMVVEDFREIKYPWIEELTRVLHYNFKG